ncbi:MAG: patatin-like phospholipase family protein, partial [Myxococcota bacterium]
DDGARLVVSLSGGGFRLFATTPALKVVDALLDGDRQRVGEVWGCSGGALAGYVFAAGHRMSVLDEFGYDLYNGRLPGLVSGSVGSLVRGHVRAQRHRLRGRPVPAEMVEWLTELDRREPRAARGPAVPFYALATSLDRGGPFALGSPDHCDPGHDDFLIPCDPWLGVAASTAVPFLVRAVRGIGSRPDEQWIDGSIADESPLYLPFLKWQRERERSPETTPERLKILLVQLNLRSSESAVMTALSRFGATRSTVVRAARLFDTMLDSKTQMVVSMLSRHPQVEILCARLSLGWLGLHSPAEIPRAIRTGRTLASWSFTRYPEAAG